MSFPALIRNGNEKGLLRGDWPTWQNYREMRKITSHAYEEGKARLVTQAIPASTEEARALVRRLEDGVG